jgi:uncharacterized protein YecE (DUF72 family)
MLYIGCAGWTIPKQVSTEFPAGGSHLERYAQVLPCSEINTSFYRPHRKLTWERWGNSVPAAFRFAVKAPRTITHDQSLSCSKEDLLAFFDQVFLLGEKLGPILFQTPPKLAFDEKVVAKFLALLRTIYSGQVVIEPRHVSWFTSPAESVLSDFQVGRVAADPAPIAAGGLPGGSRLLSYYRLHGTPRKYYSAYSSEALASLVAAVQGEVQVKDVWVIFDNTASGAAAADALRLSRMFSEPIASSAKAKSPESSGDSRKLK